MWKLLTIQLAAIPGINEESHRPFQRIGATGKATGTPMQTRQVMTKLSIHALYPIGLAFVRHRRMLSGVIDQFLIRSQQITVVPMRSWTLVHQRLQCGFVSLLAD